MAVAWRQNSSFYQKYLLHMMSLYKTRADFKMYLELLLSLATIAIFILFAIKPTLTTIANLSSEISAKQEIVTGLDQKIAALGQAQQLVEQHSSQIAILNESIPSTPEVTNYIKQIEGLAQNHSLLVETMETNSVSLIGPPIDSSQTSSANQNEIPPSPLPDGASPIPVNFSISGQYSDLISFLADVENLRRPTAIDSIAINSIETINQTGTIQLTIKGRVPYTYEQQ